jgi:hypothetical protein
MGTTLEIRHAKSITPSAIAAEKARRKANRGLDKEERKANRASNWYIGLLSSEEFDAIEAGETVVKTWSSGATDTFSLKSVAVKAIAAPKPVVTGVISDDGHTVVIA